MSKAVEQLEKLADRFENKLRKVAQALPLANEPDVDVIYLDALLDKLFSTADRTKIINDIANGVDEEDIKSITTSVSINNKIVSGKVFINGSSDPDAKGSSILTNALSAKIKEPDLTKYNGTFVKSWMHYTK